MAKILLIIGGILNIILAILHLYFWKDPEFNWKEQLPKMNVYNRAMIQISNIVFIYVLLCFAGISFFLSAQNPLDTLGKIVILFIGGFYVARAILEFPFFGFSKTGVVIFVICLLIAGCYFAALI
jgi:hypothetical protein